MTRRLHIGYHDKSTITWQKKINDQQISTKLTTLNIEVEQTQTLPKLGLFKLFLLTDVFIKISKVVSGTFVRSFST